MYKRQIIPNYALIDEYNINIVGEHYLEISHNLMALKGQSLDDIKEIHSHPMALLQCRDFLKENPSIKLVEDKDTANVAKKISNTKTMGIGAIASKLAAKIYDLNLIKSIFLIWSLIFIIVLFDCIFAFFQSYDSFLILSAFCAKCRPGCIAMHQNYNCMSTRRMLSNTCNTLCP